MVDKKVKNLIGATMTRNHNLKIWRELKLVLGLKKMRIIEGGMNCNTSKSLTESP